MKTHFADDETLKRMSELEIQVKELREALEYYAAMKGPLGWPARNVLEHTK